MSVNGMVCQIVASVSVIVVICHCCGLQTRTVIGVVVVNVVRIDGTAIARALMFCWEVLAGGPLNRLYHYVLPVSKFAMSVLLLILL